MGKASLTERSLAIAAEVDRVAHEIGCSSSQVALAWVRAQDRGNLIPILGVRRLAQLEDNLGALTLALTREHLERLDAASRIELGYPLDLLARVSDRSTARRSTRSTSGADLGDQSAATRKSISVVAGSEIIRS